MKIDLTEREWRHIKVGLLQSISNADKCSKCKFDDNALIKELLKIHDKIAVAMENEKTNQKKQKATLLTLIKENIMQAKVFISN